MKISLKVIAIVFAVLISGALLYAFIGNSKEENVNSVQDVDYDKLDEIVFDVKTSRILKGDLEKSITANGIVKANKELSVSSNLSGYIDKVNVHDGMYVQKGELLISLDDREYQLALKDAEVRVTEARVEYGFLIKDTPSDTSAQNQAKKFEAEIKKVDEKYNAGELTLEKYNQITDSLELELLFTGAKREELVLNKSGLTTAINGVKKARLNLEYTKIKSPFAGVVGNFDMVEGERITSGTELFKLFDINKLKLEVGVLESEVTGLQINSVAEIISPALSDKIFNGKVKYISPYIDTQSKTCKVTIEIANQDNLIKPGMFAKVKVVTKVLHDKILIPKEALLVRDRRNLVFVAEEDLAKWKYVEIGDQNDKYIEVLSGVNPDEEIIVEGHFTLAHDSKVKIKN